MTMAIINLLKVIPVLKQKTINIFSCECDIVYFKLKFRVDLHAYMMSNYHSPSHKCIISIVKLICTKIFHWQCNMSM